MDKKQEIVAKLGILVMEIEKLLDKASDTVSVSTGYWTGTASDKARSEFGFQFEEIACALEGIKKNLDGLIQCEKIEIETSDLSEKNKMLDADIII